MLKIPKHFNFKRIVMGSVARPNDANEHVIRIEDLHETWEYLSCYDSKVGLEDLESLAAHKKHFHDLMKKARVFHTWFGNGMLVSNILQQIQELLMLISLAEKTVLEMIARKASGSPLSKIVYTINGPMPQKKTKKIKKKEEEEPIAKAETKTIEKEKSKVPNKPHEKKKRETRKMKNKKQ